MTTTTPLRRTAVVHLRHKDISLDDFDVTTAEGGDNPQQWLISCRSARDTRTAIGYFGHIERIPPNAFVAVATPADVSHLRDKTGTSFVATPFLPQYKYDAAHLSAANFSAAAAAAAATNPSARFLAYRVNLLGTGEVVEELLRTFNKKAEAAGDWLCGESGQACVKLRRVGELQLRLLVVLRYAALNRQAHSILRKAIEFLARQPSVHWLEPAAAPAVVLNGAAKQTTQGEGALFRFSPGRDTPRDWRRAPGEAQPASNPSQYEPLPGASDPGLSSFGLNGNGEVVSVGDTGLDHTVAFFQDVSGENVTMLKDPFFFNETNETSAVLNKSHRKIIGYWPLMDARDYAGGHGTHVAGTVAGAAGHACAIAGERQCSLARFDGMAPEAKLLFADLQCNTPDGCDCGWHEWCPCVDYPDGRCPSDQYLYPPDDLASGYLRPLYNLGARINSNSWGRGCPSGGWCASAGSTARDVDAFIWEHDDFLVLFAAGNDGDDNGFSSLDAQAYEKNGMTIGASRSSSLSAEQTVSGREALRKSSTSIAKCKPEKEACVSSTCACPAHVVKNCSTGCETGCSERCWQSQFVESIAGKENPAFREVDQDLAYFTSMGPTSGGRWKPDIVAPGYYVASAKSHSGEQPFGEESFCGGGSQSGLSKSQTEWVSPHSDVHDGPFKALNSSSGNNSSLAFFNELSIQTTHSLSAVFLDLNFIIRGDSYAIVTAVILESAEALGLGMQLAPVQNASVHMTSEALESSDACDRSGRSTNEFACTLTFPFEPNVTLWANARYWVGYEVTASSASSVRYRIPRPAQGVLNGRNESDSCFGAWAHAYTAQSTRSLVCNKETVEAVERDGAAAPGSYFPIGLQLHISERDVLRNHLQVMAGTSMATPVVAGSAAIVRQYYSGGYYANASETLSALTGELSMLEREKVDDCASFPHGCCESDRATLKMSTSEEGCPPRANEGGGLMTVSARGGFDPSASLVKATIINGATPLAGRMCTGSGDVDLLQRREKLEGEGYTAIEGAVSVCGPVRDAPYLGHGRVSLADSLAIYGGNATTAPALRLEVPGLSLGYSVELGKLFLRQPFLSDAEEHEFCFQLPALPPQRSVPETYISPDHIPISVTISWTDPPASPSASQYLVHDLNLAVDEIGSENPAFGGYVGSLWAPGEGRTFLGNNDPEAWPHHFEDSTNNVEKIRIFRNTSIARGRIAAVSDPPAFSPFLATDTFRVRVSGAQVAFGPQAYALIVTGPGLRPAPCPAAAPTSETGHAPFGGIAVFSLLLGLTLLVSIGVILLWVTWNSSRMADEDSPGAPEPRVPRRVRSRGYAPAAAAAEAGGPAAAVASMTSNPMRLRRADQEEEEDGL